ncbi:MAG: polysaccharide biosynthesis tyrosine autokinase, partial [Vibrio sp.]
IIAVTFVFAVLGVSYALLATPIYKTDALIQVEQKSSGMPALNTDMADLFATESPATTEIEIIKSRMVLGETVDNLHLTIQASPNYMPVIGKGLARLTGNSKHIQVQRFDIAPHIIPDAYTLTLVDETQGTYSLEDSEGNTVLEGKVGELAKAKDDSIELLVDSIKAEAGSSFTLSKTSRLDAIQRLQQNLSVSERGKQTGILTLSFTGENRAKIQAILNDISNNYLMQNVARNSAEAESSLVFLKKHLPEIKTELTKAEDKLNAYRQNNESVDLNMEAQSTLDVMVTLESQLNELTFKESDISQSFTKNHPAYKSLLDKRKQLLAEKARLEKRIEKLPQTQREVLRMTRDVEVTQQIYIQLLNKVQELNIVKASTVGNVRIIDSAQSYTNPVKPKKPLIAVLATLLGGMLSVAIVLLRAALHRGIESPDEIEAIGMPVYAAVPLSAKQASLDKLKNRKNQRIQDTLLTLADPTDLSVESLRSLRTSLHFAMMETNNKVIMISGPSPSMGKTFIASNMAAVIAQSGKQVLLIGSDMRKGHLHKIMQTPTSPGLSDYLSGQVELDNIIYDVDFPHMHTIPRGTIPPNPSELLMHPRFEALLVWANEHYDTIVIDTPPILAVTDAAIIGKHAGTTFMVAKANQTSIKELEIAHKRFEQNGIDVKGVILNGMVKNASSRYGGYDHYHYEYSSSKS